MTSRITAGDITNLITPNEIQRGGFAGIFEIVKPTKGLFLRSIVIELDDDTVFYNPNAERTENNENTYSINRLNDALEEDNLFLANFRYLFPSPACCNIPDPENYDGTLFSGFYLGSGDIYIPKKVDFRASLTNPRIRIPVPGKN